MLLTPDLSKKQCHLSQAGWAKMTSPGGHSNNTGVPPDQKNKAEELTHLSINIGTFYLRMQTGANVIKLFPSLLMTWQHNKPESSYVKSVFSG